MEEDIAKYSCQLANLKMNSKPLINLLTMMAEDYTRHAPIIVQLIEKHLATVKAEIKLPALYLVDSIIKNVRKEYVELFTQNIVSTFCGVFEKVDEKTRGLLFKLRGTWKDYFPAKKLYAIDVRCRQIDPNWPITAPAPTTGSIHVNPRFLNRGKPPPVIVTSEHILAHSTAAVPQIDTSVSDVQMRAQLLAKQKELLELQTKKVELELLQAELQMKAKAQAQQEEAAKQIDIDIAQKQERLLLGMAETAKSRTEQYQQQLSSLHPKPSSFTPSSSIPVVKQNPPSKNYEVSSDRESHHSHSVSTKVAKSNSEASNSSVDVSPSKKSKSSSRDKSERDRKDRSKGSKDKEKDKHDSKESRHSRRDKSRHESNKDKNRSSNESRGRESSSSSTSTSKSGGGEWKDYNEVKKMSLSPPKRSAKKEPVGSDEEAEITLDIKPHHKRAPSPTPPLKSVTPARTSERDTELHSKSPNSTLSQSSDGGSSSSSPQKRKFPKTEKDYVKERDGKQDKASKESKPVISDPRLRRKMEREKVSKGDEKNKESPGKTAGEWKDYRERQKAVLRRNYRKTTGIENDEASGAAGENDKMDTVVGSDVDLRFEAHMDVDLRGEVDGPEPPMKKSRPGKDSAFDDLFGHQDVDLRAPSGCWTQVKRTNSESVSDLTSSDGNPLDEDDRLSVDTNKVLRSPGPSTGSGRVLRSPGPSSPVSSVNPAVKYDPLGRPLVYNRLPNDPEERKRSLDSRSSSIDPIEQFRARYVDRALQASGQLSNNDMKVICVKAKEEFDQGFLNKDQYVALMREVVQVGSKISEATALREAQQMQMKDDSWQMSKPNNAPNPWVTAAENTENNIWAAAANIGPTPVAPLAGVPDFTVRFPGPNNTPWDSTPKMTPWMAPNIPHAPAGPNPFEQAIARPTMMADDMIPKANPKELRVAEQDVGRTIPIDKVMREVRFYRDLSIIFMGAMNDDPRELAFQRDELPRTVLINGKPLEVYLGEAKKFDLNRVPHTLRIGAPGRELCLDDRRYELFFGGGTKKIFVDGRPHSFQLLPPSPQVTVGQISRHDLCAGRVMLTVDAVSNVPVYLDEKVQKIDLLGESVVLRFCDGFKTVTLNGRPFPVSFGARLPFSVTLPGHVKHFLRFAAISRETEQAIQEFITVNYGGGKLSQSKDIVLGLYNRQRRLSNDYKRALVSHSNNLDLDLELLGGRGGRGGMMRGNGARGRGRGGRRDMSMDVRQSGLNPWESEGPSEVIENPLTSNANPLDLLNNFFHTSSPDPHSKNKFLNHSYESDRPQVEENKEQESEAQNNSDPVTAGGGNVNVSDLVANLIKFGLLPPAPAVATEETSDKPTEEKVTNEGGEEQPSEPEPKPEEKEEKEKVITIPPLPFVDLSLTDNLKERRDIVIGQISTGVQCSQCGLRFPPDQTIRYSQHLDWHFRKNRREKANARKALSRKWYYDLSDWIQFEEIEDLEERAASLFESQEAENENDAKSPSGALNQEECSVLASFHEGAVCPQCGETFESYFDEELEEWRLRNAKLDDYEGEQKLYHPICHQDYLRSLVEESIVEEDEPVAEPILEGTHENEDKENVPKAAAEEEQQEEEDEVLIIKEGKKEVVVMEIDIDDDDVEKNATNNEIVSVTEKNEENTLNSNIVNNGTKTDNATIVIDEENINNLEKVGENSCTGNDSSLEANATSANDGKMVQSPIIIDEDSTFLPGLSDEAQVGVFGFALGTNTQREPSLEPAVDEKKIIYEPMKFDIPPIKQEPPDEDDAASDSGAINPDDFLNNLQPFIPTSSTGENQSEPMNIDLTEEDSADAVESGARLVMQIRTSIDGNLQHEEAAALPYIPAPKIRINLFGVDSSPVNSPKDSKTEGPQISGKVDGDNESQDQMLKDDGSANNVVSNSTEINKDHIPDEPVLSEEMKRLKPRLVGRKLTNYPPKFKGKEESGLCVIC